MFRNILIVFALAAMIPFTSSICHAKPSRKLVKNPGFETSMDGWKTMGQAQYDLDPSFKHSGSNSIRIRVDSTSKLEYQQIYYSMPVKPGQVYKGSFWVYYSKMTDGIGAYGVVEFWNGKERLASGVHTDPIPNLSHPNEWLHLDAEAEAPEHATDMRLVMVLHSHGTAWFDDAEIICLMEAPRKDQIPVKLSLKPKEVINPEWHGFGFQGDLFLNYQHLKDLGVDDADKKLIRQRILDMHPQIVRLCANLTDWEDKRGVHTADNEAMTGLKETLAIYKEAGAEIQLTEWGYRVPDWCRSADRLPHPDERRAYTDSWVSLIKYLRNDCGFTNIRYFTFLNEPNSIDFKGYAAVIRSFDVSLKAAGLRKDVLIVGPDEADGHQLLLRAIENLDDVIDCFDAHNYTSNTGREFGIWASVRTSEMPEIKGEQKTRARKPFLITEFGMRDGMDTFFTPHNHEYNYGFFMADSAVNACMEGASAMSNWCLMDTEYGNTRMKWGLWRFKDEQWEPRPGYYAWSLITRYTALGSTVYHLKSDSASVPAVAFKAPGQGLWTLMAVNRLEEPRPLTIQGLPHNSKWQPYIYSKDTVPTKDQGMIPPGATITADSKGRIEYKMPARAFVLWHQTL